MVDDLRLKVGYMSRVATKGNEAKCKMKHHIEMSIAKFELR